MLFLSSQSQDKQKTKSPVAIHPIAPFATVIRKDASQQIIE